MVDDKKRLVISGALRKKKNTDQVSKDLVQALGGAKTIYLRDLDFTGCIACGGCDKKPFCILKDDLREVYPLVETCQELVLASPVYFNGVSWLMKKWVDRLQAYFHHKMDWPTRGRAYLILVGGAPGYKNQFTGPSLELSLAAKSLGFKDLLEVHVPDTDRVSFKTGSLPLDLLEENVVLKRKEEDLWESTKL